MRRTKNWKRRDFLKAVGFGAAASVAAFEPSHAISVSLPSSTDVLTIDPAPLF